MGKKVSPLVAAARQSNPHAKRMTLERPEYQELCAEILAFAQDRADGNHGCSWYWFKTNGIKYLNDARRAENKPPLVCSVTPNTIMNWLCRHHPELEQVFRR